MNRAALTLLEEAVGGDARVLNTRIRTDEATKKAQALGLTLSQFAAQTRKPSHAAEDYLRLASELEARCLSERVA